jgi:hypothetical protein
MPIAAPSIQWPANFIEEGPAEDPTILLSAQAGVAGVPFKVSALRMRAGLRTPDYRDDVPKKIYEPALDGMLDDIEDLMDSIEPQLLGINGAQYLLWMMPAERD